MAAITSPTPSLFVTGSAVAPDSGSGSVKVPVDAIHPAPGLEGLVTLSASGGAVALTGPGCPTGFVLPSGSVVNWLLGGVKLAATSSGGAGTISWAYATNGT
jgi:hypothetical protein